jgi:hypothetical protein
MLQWQQETASKNDDSVGVAWNICHVLKIKL